MSFAQKQREHLAQRDGGVSEREAWREEWAFSATGSMRSAGGCGVTRKHMDVEK